MKKIEDDDSHIATGEVRAFILCGGLGTRLRPVLEDRPKSMALISGIPFMQVLMERLKAEGVNDIILGTGYMAEKIQSYFGDGNDFGLRLRYSRESEPLGTGGAVKLAESQLSDPVLVLNGDSYVNWSLAPMREIMAAKDALVVMGVQGVTNVTRYGTVAVDREGRITEFVEKGVQSGPGLINAGVYLIRKQIVRNLPASVAISLEKDVFPCLLDHKICAAMCTGPFIDIGTPDDFERAQALLASQTQAASSYQHDCESTPQGQGRGCDREI